MNVFLLLAAIIAVLFAVGIFSISQSAIHEIEALILFLIGAVLFTGFAIIDEVRKLKSITPLTPPTGGQGALT